MGVLGPAVKKWNKNMMAHTESVAVISFLGGTFRHDMLKVRPYQHDMCIFGAVANLLLVAKIVEGIRRWECNAKEWIVRSFSTSNKTKRMNGNRNE